MKPLPRLALTLSALLLALPGGAGDLPRAQQSYDRALASYLNGDFREALTSANEALSSNRSFGLALALRARVWQVLGDWPRMESDIGDALSQLKGRSLDPDQLIAQGSVFLLKGDLDRAMASFTTSMGVRKSAEGYAARARAFRVKGDFAAEAAELTSAILVNPRAALYHHNRAHAYYDLGQDDKALADLTAALKLNRNCYVSFGLLGSVLARKADPSRALKAYNKALALNSEYVYAYLGRAAVYLAQGDAEAAFKDLGQATRIAPRDFSPWFNRAEAYAKRGSRDESLADYRKTLDADLRDPQVAMAVGDRFSRYSLWKEAIAAYTLARELRPSAAPLVRRAAAWEALKKNKAALADLNSAVDVEPASTSAWTARGLLWLGMGNPDKALADLARAIKLDPKAPGVRVARGKFYARTGRAALALEDFNAALLADPNMADAYNNRGALYANALNDTDKALSDIASAVALEPQNTAYQFNLGMMRLKARHFQKAIEAFDTALKLKGPTSLILQARADAHAQLGEHAAARRDIQLALEHDTRNASIYDTLGTIRLAGHEYEQAVRDLNQALHLSSKLVPALIHRGMAYGGLGQYKNALNDFHRAADLDPKVKEAWTGLCTTRRLREDYTGAVKDCRRAIQLDPNYGPAYLQEGIAYLQLRDPNHAISDLHNAYQLGVRRAEGLLGQSYGHALAKEYKEAHRVYLAALALDPNVKSFQSGFGAPRGEASDYFTAMADIESLMATDIADPYAFILRADAMQNAGHYDKAILEYTKAMELDGSVAEAYVGRGNTLLAQEAYDAAQQDFIRAAELSKTEADPLLRLATLMTIRRNYKGAMAQVMSALKLEPKNPEAYLRAGNIYYFQGSYQRALENYELAAKYDPYLAAAYNGVGMAYFALQKYPLALDNFSRAIALGPTCDRYYRNRASTYANLGQFVNAAAGFKSASLVNTDPSMVEEYQTLIKDAESHLTTGKN